MYANKYVSKTQTNHPVRQRKQARSGGSHFPDNRPEAFLLKKMRQTMESGSAVLQKSENKTGLPDNLKTGVEHLSGHSMDDVKVHYNSGKPAQLQAHAYAQGSDIHLAPGQEKHLPHEAWHVVQQKQGRVQPTTQLKGTTPINDDAGLEQEADTMGRKALELHAQTSGEKPLSEGKNATAVVQQMPDWMLKLIAMAKENKLVVGGTAAVTVGGILLYYYCKKKPGAVPPQIEEEVQEPPSYESLQELAEACEVDIEELRTQLETGIGNITVQEFYRKGLTQNTFVPLLVHPSLIRDLPETSEKAKFDELLGRFNHFPFTYTGKGHSAGTGFLTRTGDCSTLTQMFLYATMAAGIEGVEFNSEDEMMLVPSAAIHGRDTLGNVEGALCWVFANHYWCEYQGERYDLLFRRTGKHQISYLDSTKVYQGVTYSVYKNGYAVIDANMFHLFETAFTKGSEGYAAINEDAIKEYIDTNKK